MSARYVVRPVGRDELRWHDELPADPASLVDLFWLDGDLENGYQIGIGLIRCRPLADGLPAVTIKILPPDGDVLEVNETFEPEDFDGDAFGGRWGDRNRIVGEFDANGRPTGYRLVLSVGGIEVDVACRAVCTGAKFVDASPGYTAYDPVQRHAAGWWPLIPRATSTGHITVRGLPVDGTGAFHLERQVSSFPLGGSDGEKSAQSIWTWGHFYAGDYTAVWTDSGASAQFGYRHFTPFLLWRGSELVLSTFAFASYVERFTINPRTGLAMPAVTTLKAADGGTEFFARLLSPRNSEHVVLNNKPGSLYSRQLSEVQARLDGPGGTERLTGRAVHEWGTQAGNFPFLTATPERP
ncbi:hypothetical protein Franean1_2680 [Parafrankia sp. EAN1pec]|uniref:hypothetical protein n=1 Tax=Parafrankia sp. (strain EAN1pec) TaxID=298653 RepID=UPI0000543969|nr:hypothetical protein Franean1_2680 [Frankia sp. EAN1pec]